MDYHNEEPTDKKPSKFGHTCMPNGGITLNKIGPQYHLYNLQVVCRSKAKGFSFSDLVIADIRESTLA